MSAAKAARTDVNGVLLLDKPHGLTSQQAVARVKRLFAARKAGHTGTLDPMADGLLPMGLGEATKFSQFLLDADKGYLASLQLGVTTTTADAEGEILEQKPVSVTLASIEDALHRFVGEQTQMPPMHSAIKVAGKPLYAYARAGVAVERKSRTICINNIQLIDFKENNIKIRVQCSKGTYIRVLAADIGRVLGCGAHLSALRRTRVADLDLANAVTLAELEALAEEARPARLAPVDALLSSLPQVELDPAAAERFSHGNPVALLPGPGGKIRVYAAGRLLGVGEPGTDGRLWPKRLVQLAV